MGISASDSKIGFTWNVGVNVTLDDRSGGCRQLMGTRLAVFALKCPSHNESKCGDVLLVANKPCSRLQRQSGPRVLSFEGDLP